MRRVPWELPRERERLVVAAFLAVAAALILYASWDTTFFRDEWDFLQFRDGSTLDNVLGAHAGHPTVIPVGLYLIWFDLFGLDGHLVYRLPVLVLHLICCVEVWFFLRSRTPAVPRMAIVAVLALLGSAWDDILWGFQVGFLTSVAAGLGALLCLDRERPRQVLASVLVLLSVFSSGAGLAFLAATWAGALTERLRLRTLLGGLTIVTLLFGAWYQKHGGTSVRASQQTLADAPGFAVQAAGSAVGGLTGLGHEVGLVLVVPLLLLVARELLRRAVLSRVFVAAAVAAVAYFGLISAAPLTGVSPFETRYVYPGVVLLVVLSAEAFRGWTPPAWRGGALAVVLLFLVALGSNVLSLLDMGDMLQNGTPSTRARLAAIELAGPPKQAATVEIPGQGYTIDVNAYMGAVRRWGSSPALAREELPAQDPSIRAEVDAVLLQLAPPVAAPVAADGVCGTVVPRSAIEGTLRPAGATVAAHGGDVELTFRRFGETPGGKVVVAQGEAVRVSPPRDADPRPWTMTVQGAGAGRACIAR